MVDEIVVELNEHFTTGHDHMITHMMPFQERSCSGDIEVGASGSADDLAAVGVVGFGSGFDRGAELRIESNWDDFGGSSAEQRTPAAATLEGFGVVASDGDLVGECVEVGFGQGLA